MLSKTDYPELSSFLEGMYHQDWSHIAPTFAGVIEEFGPRLGAEEVHDTLAELDRILSAPASESEFAEYLLATGASVAPEGEDLTARGFLELVRDELRKLAR